MTLNSSGPISLGGSTTGQSINLELGFSATALASINSTSFRTLAAVASGQISLSNFYGKSNATYWFATFAPSTMTFLAGHAVNPSNGNIILVLNTSNGATKYSTVYKISPSGSVTSNNSVYSNSGAFMQGQAGGTLAASGPSFALDASCNVYGTTSQIPGFNKYITNSNTFGFFYSVNGNQNLNLMLTDGTYYYMPKPRYFGCCCGCHNSGFIYYTCGGTISGSTFSNFTSSDPAYMAYDGYSSFYLSTQSGIMTKFYRTSSVWEYGMPGNADTRAVAANATYMGYISYATYLGISNIASASSTVKPTVVYAVTISNGSYNTSYTICGVTIDSSNNVYFVQQTPTSGNYGFIVTKVNSSGTLQWQRKFTTSANIQSFTVSSKGSYLYVSWAVAASPTGAQLIQYPTDGSKTGTYTAGGISVTISAGTCTYTSSGSNTWGAAYNTGYYTAGYSQIQSFTGNGSTAITSTNSFTTL